MNSRSSIRRVVVLLGSLLACAGLTGCPDDDEKPKQDAGEGHAHGDAGESDCHLNDCGPGNQGKDASTGGGDVDASMGGGDVDASTGGGGTDAGVGEVNGGEIDGDAFFHVVYSNPKDSNVKTDPLHSTMPSGTSAVNGTLRGTSLAASGPGQSITIQLSGEIRVGATFELMPDPIQTTEGYAFIQVLQHPNWFRSASGTITLDAVQGNKVKFSTTVVPMIVATNNAPGNTGTGTFDIEVEGQVFEISGL